MTAVAEYGSFLAAKSYRPPSSDVEPREMHASLYGFQTPRAFKVILPDGTLYEGVNVQAFARERGVSYALIQGLVVGRHKTSRIGYRSAMSA